jgi:hypothetical protein
MEKTREIKLIGDKKGITPLESLYLEEPERQWP